MLNMRERLDSLSLTFVRVIGDYIMLPRSCQDKLAPSLKPGAFLIVTIYRRSCRGHERKDPSRLTIINNIGSPKRVLIAGFSLAGCAILPPSRE